MSWRINMITILSMLWTLQGVWCDTPLTFTSSWPTGHKGKLCVPVNKELHDWRIHIVFSDPVSKLDVFEAEVVSSLNKDTEYIIKNEVWNGAEHPGDQICEEFIAHTDSTVASLSGRAFLEGTGGGVSGQTLPPGVSGTRPSLTLPPASGTDHTGGGTAKYDYEKVLGLSILFYDAQRSGKLPANNPISWRGDSSLTDRGEDGKDLTGGWYDAGDLMKDNFPMASATTILSWGFLKWSDAYKKAGQEDNMYDMIKTPLDYFLKCWNPTKKEYYVQIGEGSLDSSYWGRPEDMPPNQKAFKVTAAAPGSDAAGITAAALAAGSMLFLSKDPKYSTTLLDAAVSLYNFAKTYKGIYSKSIAPAAAGYPSSGYNDELCVAASLLYKATKKDSYLVDAKGFHVASTSWALSWDDAIVECQLMLYELTNDASYKTEVESFLTSWRPGGTVTYSPCGLAFRSKWGSLRYDANAVFVALAAAEDGIHPLENRQWALSQINYMLGDNKQDMSFVIGFGTKYPLQPHHRASSCPDPPATCDWNAFNAPGPNPHVLKGGLVGGPLGNDSYVDKRGDYVQNEVAVDYNAGFQSAIAGLIHLTLSGDLPPAPTAKC
ncbi:LOW QUALITY PROTEIN: endoglucanase E-4-like [Haliotis rubra]|uniref:LOW QUALITY PROTEIN: endoglucanase E-4-like n=1 Tax=Haliotis rubra TaxID=36100 RepID=UPI001EE5227D|nr:LOW QUALITY PROTEIN: endoglucanase E-4-like [Haliotis rubra]